MFYCCPVSGSPTSIAIWNLRLTCNWVFALESLSLPPCLLVIHTQISFKGERYLEPKNHYSFYSNGGCDILIIS